MSKSVNERFTEATNPPADPPAPQRTPPSQPRVPKPPAAQTFADKSKAPPPAPSGRPAVKQTFAKG